MNKLSFLLNSVKCLDETGGKYREWLGNDEIYMFGFGLLSNGLTTVIRIFEPGGNFDDGEIVNYNPPKILNSNEFNGQLDAIYTLWIYEKDINLIDIRWSEINNYYLRMVQERVVELRVAGETNIIQAHKDILEKVHKRVCDIAENYTWISNADDEVFPYMTFETPPQNISIIKSYETPITNKVVTAHDGKYEIKAHFKFEKSVNHSGGLNPNDDGV
jgi:hypothetical protein